MKKTNIHQIIINSKLQIRSKLAIKNLTNRQIKTTKLKYATLMNSQMKNSPIFTPVNFSFALLNQPNPPITSIWHSFCQFANIPQEL